MPGLQSLMLPTQNVPNKRPKQLVRQKCFEKRFSLTFRRVLEYTVVWLFPGGGVLPYVGYIVMCRCERYGFQAVYPRIGYINQSGGVQNRVSFFRKQIKQLKILSRLGMWYKVLFWLDYCASDLGSFWKTVTLGQGGFGDFTLVQGSKIQLNQLWYRLRVPVSQQHIPIQKFLKYPPSGGV